ncbi:MAG: efflux RND transporter periplasmic adaptor subunit [Pseudobdellovibrionaceae bacterium]
MQKKLSVLFLTCLLSLSFWFSHTGFAQVKQDKKGAIPAVNVITAPVREAEFSDRVEALGTALANETVVITADTTEKVSAIHFEDGQEVAKGDLLVTLDKSEEEADLSAAEAQLTEARSAYNRAQDLQKTSALSKATLQQRLAALKQAESQIEAIKSRINELTITAPFDGILGLREVSVGALVQPGDTITTIDDLSRIKVDFDVPSVFLPSLQTGLPIIGKVDAYQDKDFKGEVQTVNARVDPITRTVRVRAILPNPDALLKPGLLMTITLLKDARQALLIPEEALIKKDDRNFVYVVKETDANTKEAVEREVKIGAREEGHIEILDGLQENESVVIHGTLKLRDKTPVTVMAVQDKGQRLPELLEQAQESRQSGVAD